MVCEVCGEDTYQFGRWVFTSSLNGEPLIVRSWDPFVSREQRWICNKCADPPPTCTERELDVLGELSDQIGKIGRWVFTPSLIGDPLVAGWSLDGDLLDPWMVRRGDRTPARKDTPPPFVNQEDSPQNAVEKAVKTGEQRSNAVQQVAPIVQQAFERFSKSVSNLEKWLPGLVTSARENMPTPMANPKDSLYPKGEVLDERELFVDICERHLLETCIDPATGIVVPTSQGIAAWLQATPCTRRSLVLMKNDHDLREHDLREQTEDLLPKKMAEDLLTNVLCDELLTCLMVLYIVSM